MSDMWGDREEHQDMLPLGFIFAGAIGFLGGLAYLAYTLKNESRISGGAVIAIVEGLALFAIGHYLTNGRQLDNFILKTPEWDEKASTNDNQARGYISAYLNREMINRFQKAILFASAVLFLILCWILEQICGNCV